MASDVNLTVCADPAALAETAAHLIVDAATEAVRERGRFMLCLAGGETPRATYARLALPAFSERMRWDRTWVFFGDERAVPPDHPESNYRMAYETLLSRVPIPPAQIFRMCAEQIPGPGQGQRGRLVTGEKQRHHFIAQLPIVHLAAVFIARRQQH